MVKIVSVFTVSSSRDGLTHKPNVTVTSTSLGQKKRPDYEDVLVSEREREREWVTHVHTHEQVSV